MLWRRLRNLREGGEAGQGMELWAGGLILGWRRIIGSPLAGWRPMETRSWRPRRLPWKGNTEIDSIQGLGGPCPNLRDFSMAKHYPLVLKEGLYGNDCSHNRLRWASAVLRRSPESFRVFLMGDAASSGDVGSPKGFRRNRDATGGSVLTAGPTR